MKHLFLKNLRNLNTISNQNGFTLAEVLVSIFIIALLSGIIFSSYQQGARRFALQRSANKLARDMRKVEEMAMSTKESSGATSQAGYGIYLKAANPNSYILFTDRDGDCIYDEPNEKIENLSFEPGVKIDFLAKLAGVEFLAVPELTIILTPPDPKVAICEYSNAGSAYAVLTISGLIKNVSINTAGLIEIDSALPDCVCTVWNVEYEECGGGPCLPEELGIKKQRDCYDVNNPPGCGNDPELRSMDICRTDQWKDWVKVYHGYLCCDWGHMGQGGHLDKYVANTSVLHCLDSLPCPGIVAPYYQCDCEPCWVDVGECAVKCKSSPRESCWGVEHCEP